MKINLKLGVPTEALLKHPTACFRLSSALTRVQDALAFGQFYVRETKTGAHFRFDPWYGRRSSHARDADRR
jgi:hypothetical protein